MWLCDAIYAPIRARKYAHLHISTHINTHVGTQIRAPVTFLPPVWSTFSWFASGQKIHMIVQCDCVHLRRCARMHAQTPIEGLISRNTTVYWLDLPYCRSLCILSDACFFFFFSSSFWAISLAVIFGFFVFWTLRVFYTFCRLVMFLFFSIFVCLLASFDIFAYMYVRITVFSCACDHVFTHFVRVIVRLGTGINTRVWMGFRVPNQHIRPLCHSRFFTWWFSVL